MREIVSLEQQRRIHGFGERIGRAIRQVQPRFRMDALAVMPISLRRGQHLLFIEGYNLDTVVFGIFRNNATAPGPQRMRKTVAVS